MFPLLFVAFLARLLPQLAQATQGQRPIQMTVQPNIQMQIMSTPSMSADTAQLTAVPQLTGSLTLSFSEDGRLLLKHNANAPQDAQSQMILQAFLSGALCNGEPRPKRIPFDRENRTQICSYHSAMLVCMFFFSSRMCAANVTLINETTAPVSQQVMVHPPHPTPPSTPLQSKAADVITVSKSTTPNAGKPSVNPMDKQSIQMTGKPPTFTNIIQSQPQPAQIQLTSATSNQPMTVFHPAANNIQILPVQKAVSGRPFDSVAGG